MKADNLKQAVKEQTLATKEDLEEANKWNDSMDTKIFTADESVKILTDSIKWIPPKNVTEEARERIWLWKEAVWNQEEVQDWASTSEREEWRRKNSEQNYWWQICLRAWPTDKTTQAPNSSFQWHLWGLAQVLEPICGYHWQSDNAQRNKICLLKPFPDQKVKQSVEGLPFSNEGYNRVKSILLDKYGKDLEIIKAYSQQIFDLPFIPKKNPYRIHEFCDKLTFSVQSLQTMGKLE